MSAVKVVCAPGVDLRLPIEKKRKKIESQQGLHAYRLIIVTCMSARVGISLLLAGTLGTT